MKYAKNLIAGLTIFFMLMIINGAYLIYKSNIFISEPSKIEMSMEHENIQVKAESVYPGIIFIVFGSVGLILLTIKIPVKEILGYKSPHFNDSLEFTIGRNYNLEPIFGNTIRVPYLIWLLYYRKGKAIRVH